MSKQQDNTETFSTQDLLRYAAGQLDAATMHRMERAALDDELLADAMEGYRAMVQQASPERIVALLDGVPAHAPVASLPTTGTPVVPINWAKRLAYAAAAVIAIGTGWWIYSLQSPSGQDALTDAAQAVVMDAPQSAQATDTQTTTDIAAIAPPLPPTVAVGPPPAPQPPPTAPQPAVVPPPAPAAAPEVKINESLARLDAEANATERAAADMARASREQAKKVASMESRRMAAPPATLSAPGIRVASPGADQAPTPASGWDDLLPQLKLAAGTHSAADSLSLRFTVQPGGQLDGFQYQGKWRPNARAEVKALLEQQQPFALSTPKAVPVVLHWY